MSGVSPCHFLSPNYVAEAEARAYANTMLTLLRRAVLLGGASDIEFLLRHGQPTFVDNSLLDLAAQQNDAEKIEALLIHGHRFFDQEIRRKTLANAVKTDPEDIVTSLLEPCIGEVDPNFMIPINTYVSYTPLHLAVLNQNFAIVYLLLEHGANPNAQNPPGISPLHLVGDSTPHIAQHLIEHGTNVDIRDNEGCSPLHSVSDLEIAKKFLDADPNIAENSTGATALHAMLDTGDLELVTWICK
eukprot:scaffold522_cov168-Amphora_coffeaeformis.AAC.4